MIRAKYLGNWRILHRAGRRFGWMLAWSLAVAYAAVPPVNPANSLQGFPFTEEKLNYSIKFPTGISLGDAQLAAKRDAARGWSFSFGLNASLPGFPIIDHYGSAATADLCSIRFDRQSQHGKKQVREYTVIDRSRSLAVRATAGGGGLTEIAVGNCPHDALTFLYYIRRELGQGRLPATDTLLFGGPYQINMHYSGEKTIARDKQQVPVDQVDCTIKGPASQVRLEVLFARDAARTPLVIRCPFVLGTFSMELIR